MNRVLGWLRARTPAQILLAGLTLFWIYCWPGFVGWDTYEHMVQAKAGVYTDGHPPAIARLQRLCELFIHGPLLMMLIQSITLMVGLFMLFRTRLPPRRAAAVSVLIFLFPVVAGVTALIAKDSLMAGFAMIGIALLNDKSDERRTRSSAAGAAEVNDKRPGRQWWAVVFLALASLMRWNAVAATFVPMLFLFRWRPGITGVKRYALAIAVWLGFTGAAWAANEVMTTKPEYYWYWSHAYEDIAGTLQYVDPVDDATLKTWLDGVPLHVEKDIQARLRAIYDPAQYFQYVRDPATRIFAMPTTADHRDAIARAWNRIVLGHVEAYLHYRYDNFRLVLGLDGHATFSNVYVWLSVIAAPETIADIEHDAARGVIQNKLIVASTWISLTTLYARYIYFFACFVLLALCLRRPLEASIFLSAIGYQLQWFFLAPTPDVRYSQWMVLCSLVGAALLVTSWRRSETNAGLPADEPAK